MQGCSGIDCTFTDNKCQEHLLHHIKNDIPTKITYDQLSLLPSRSDFLDVTAKNAFRQQVQRGRPLMFMPTAVTERNDWFVGGVAKYQVYMFGVLPCGSKTCVILSDIDVHFDIMVPSGTSVREYDDLLRGQLITKNISFTKIETVNQFSLHGFQKSKRPWKRIYFNNLTDRKNCIEFIEKQNKLNKEAGRSKLETAADDLGSANYYFSKVARDFRFATADWNRFENYEVLNSNTMTNCEYVFRVKVGDFKKLDKTRRAELTKPGQFLEKVIDRDPTMVKIWDIETHSTVQNGMVPTVLDNNFTIFMICSSYGFHHSENISFGVCCVNSAANARPGVKLIIECGTEYNVLDAHIKVVGRMAPDIAGAFNGANFDWPLFREKCRRYDLLVELKRKYSSLPLIESGRMKDTSESIMKWNFSAPRVKIDAETTHAMSCVAEFPGMLDTDVMPVFLKMYPRAEVRKSASLNFFLAKNGLPSKEDMPYKRMFKIYERSLKVAQIKSCHCGDAQALCGCCQEQIKEIDCVPLAAETMETTEYSNELYDDIKCCCFCGKKPRNARDMADVGYYCMVDCIRPHQLYVKRTIIPDKRELSTMSYVSLYDSFYRADGMKVCNLIGAYCNKRGIAFSNARSDKTDSDKDHYPGAWVFPPNRGLHSDGMMVVEFTAPDGTKTKRLVRCRPITGLDFASLYPSLMMAYNLSPDMVVYNLEDVEKLLAEGYSIHHIKPFSFERGKKKKQAGNKIMTAEGWTVRHNGIHNINRDKKTAAGHTKIEKYEITSTEGVKETISFPSGAARPEQTAALDAATQAKSKIVRKVSYVPNAGRDPLPGEHMGIFPYIVKKLFDKRVPIKGEFVRLSKLKEEMELKKVKEIEITVDGRVYITTYKDVTFTLNKVESKQKALKVLANTFYGKSGEFRAAIYELLVAAGITSAGQMNIKKVAAFVTGMGFIVHYGDTDSIYISCPDHYYTECDEEYFSAMTKLAEEFAGVKCVPVPTDAREIEYKKRRVDLRIKWWTKQVEITMGVMSNLKEQVSDMLLADNGTCFLNMAYEEVGFPTVFCGKKKYFLTAHIESINFYPKEYFIKGIDIVKQGQAKISKQLGDEFIREALSPENERTLMEIADDKIRKFYAMDISPTMVMQSAKYRPDKRNVPVLTFVDRMKEMQARYSNDPMMMALYEPPEPGDKFDYVMVKKDCRYTIEGNKIDIRKGDQMEYLRVYKASQQTSNPLELDLNYYMKNAIVGIFSRFIAYHDDFQPANKYNIDDKEEYKKMDAECIKLAGKFLDAMVDKITGFDKTAGARIGRDYKAIYRQAYKQVRRDLTSRLGGASFVIHGITIHTATDETRAKSTIFVEQIKNLAQDLSKNVCGESFLDINATRANLSLFQMRRLLSGDRNPSNISRHRIKLCERKEAGLIEKLFQLAPGVIKIIQKYENDIARLIDDMRTIKFTDDIIVDEEDIDELNEFGNAEKSAVISLYDCMIGLIASYKTRAQVLANVRAVDEARASSVGTIVDPDINMRTVAQTESQSALVIPPYDWS